MNARVEAIFSGRRKTHDLASKAPITTGIVKTKRHGLVPVTAIGIEGDETAVHSNAIYMYACESYTYWQQVLAQSDPWVAGFFGENLSVSGIDEEQLNIGDELHIGSVVLRVSGCRTPCETLLWRTQQRATFLQRFQTSGRTGVYLEVIQPGNISAGDQIEVHPCATKPISVAALARLFLSTSAPLEYLRRLLLCDGMGQQMLGMLHDKIYQQLDDQLAQTRAWEGWRGLRISAIVNESPSVKSFYLHDPSGLELAAFRPGQFIVVQLPAAKGRSITRCWSLSSYSEAPNYYRITIKREKSGEASNWMHDHAKVGMLLSVQAPAGQFCLSRFDGESARVLISAGVGVTPMVAMLNAEFQRPPACQPAVLWLHSSRAGEPVLFEQEIAASALKTRVNFITGTEPSRAPRSKLSGIQDVAGRINRDSLKAALDGIEGGYYGRRLPTPLSMVSVYICGPRGFINSVTADLYALGMDPSQIHSERFDVGIEQLPEQGDSFAISVEGCENIYSWQPSDGNLLTWAEANSLAVSAGCRRGECGACAAKIIVGTARSIKPIRNKTDGLLLCCSIPTSDLKIKL